MVKKLGVIGNQKTKKTIKKSCNILRDPMFVGVDPSYNGFGIVVIDKDATIVEQRLLVSDSNKSIEERLLELENGFSFIPNIVCLHSVYIEGPSFSSSGAFVLQMGALHYYLRLFLFRNETKYKVIAPGELKKFITGKGTAKKELMLLNVYKKWNVSFEDNNLCDAYSLARMALHDFLEANTGGDIKNE